MKYLFTILLISNVAFAAKTPKQIKAELSTIEDPYYAISKCGFLPGSNWAIVFETVASTQDEAKAKCLTDQKLEIEKEKTKINQNKLKLQSVIDFLKAQDCKNLSDKFLENVCTYLQIEDL